MVRAKATVSIGISTKPGMISDAKIFASLVSKNVFIIDAIAGWRNPFRRGYSTFKF